jgi:dsDNA-specific endonuclease/ATPase MutS2
MSFIGFENYEELQKENELLKKKLEVAVEALNTIRHELKNDWMMSADVTAKIALQKIKSMDGEG